MDDIKLRGSTKALESLRADLEKKAEADTVLEALGYVCKEGPNVEILEGVQWVNMKHLQRLLPQLNERLIQIALYSLEKLGLVRIKQVRSFRDKTKWFSKI